MGRRTPQSAVKRAREQALREKREIKQAKKDARSAERRDGVEAGDGGLSFEESVVRIARLANRQGGTVRADDVEGDEMLARDQATTSAAGHQLAAGANVVAAPQDDEERWFPYEELTFAEPVAETG
jgi:hypothetical protein